MSPHLSQLVLDELASGVAAPPDAKAHVDGCPECTAKLEATRRARDASKKAFGWSRTKARLTAPRPSRLMELMPFILPVAAAAVFFIAISFDLRPKKSTERLKGAASIEFVRGEQRITEARPGDRLQLEIGTAGQTHALVLAVDKDRRIDLLWEGPLPSGAFVKLPRELEVTPGPVTVHVFLSKAPVEAKVVVPAMEASMTEYAGWPLEAPAPKLEGIVTATQRLYVTP